MKRKVWEITVKDNPNRVIMGENDEFYTRDTEAYLVFKLDDKNFNPPTAVLTLENRNDGSLKNETVDVVDGLIEWEMPQRYIEHFGNWQGQLVYEDTKDGQPELYTSAPFSFVVNAHIGDKKMPSLVEIENWEKFIREGTELIETWEDLEALREENERQRQANYQELLDTGVLQTNINNKLAEAEQEYAPRLTELEQNDENLTTQLAHNKSELTQLDAIKSDKTELQNGLASKVGKGENESVTWGMLNQNAKENISGDKTAIVGANSVNTANLVNGAATYAKRTPLGTLPFITNGSSGGRIDINDVDGVMTFEGTFFIFIGNQRFTINSGTSIEFDPSKTGHAITFNVKEGLFRSRNQTWLGGMDEQEVIIGILHKSGGNLTGTWRLTANYVSENVVDFNMKTPLGNLPFIINGSSGGSIVHDEINKKVMFDGAFYIFTGNKRYLIESGTTASYDHGQYVSSHLAMYYNTVSGEVRILKHYELAQVSEDELLLGVMYESELDWKLSINYQPEYNPLLNGNQIGGFSIEKLTGDFPETDYPGVGDINSPFESSVVSHEVVYNLFDELMDKYSEYITKEELGKSRENNPIYLYKFKPEVLPEAPTTYPKMIMISSIHGNESLGTYTLYYLMRTICENWDSNSSLEYLRHYINFYVVPLPNPDDFSSGNYVDDNGVNLNRDFDGDWSPQEGSGAFPESRVETKVLSEFIRNNKDAFVYIDCHVRGNTVQNDNQLMWMGSQFGGKHYNLEKVIFTTIEKMTRKWKKQNEELADADGLLGYVSLSNVVGVTNRSYALANGIRSVLWEGFKGSPTLTDYEGQEVVNMNVQYLGETVVNSIKLFQEM